MMLSSVWIVDSWWLANGDCFLIIGIINRWSYHKSKSLTCNDSPRGISPWLNGIMDRWSYHPSKSLTRGDSPRGISPWRMWSWIDDPIIRLSRWLTMTRQKEVSPRLLGLCIDDAINRLSHWLSLTRQGGFPLDFWDDGSMMLSSVQVMDSWWLAKGDLPLTLGIMDQWSYHPS